MLSDRLFVRMRVALWEDVSLMSEQVRLARPSSNSIGFLEVFESREALLEAYPEGGVVTIVQTPKEEE